ncbi:MAG: hypothetical protein IID32_10475 [Planctomycetes bacterium]|nr:hypothetical protein [Planctomycetota bacterium]
MEANNVSELKLEAIRDEAQSAVRFLAQQLTTDLGDNLESLSVVGSALTGDFHPRKSDINTVAVVGKRSQKLLRQLAGYGSRMGKLRLQAPLLMTKEYIQQSLDVFGVEFLDFQLNHSTIYGADPFTELKFKKGDVRLQCERELKSALIKLRQGYIRAMGKTKIVGQLMIGCFSELLSLWRAELWLTDAERPKEAQPTLESAAAKFGFKTQGLKELLAAKKKHSHLPAQRVEGLFEELYELVDQMANRVNQIGKTT